MTAAAGGENKGNHARWCLGAEEVGEEENMTDRG